MKSGGELIKLARKFRGYTLKELSEMTGIPLTTISNAEREAYEPRYFTVQCCLNACGFDLDMTIREEKK